MWMYLLLMFFVVNPGLCAGDGLECPQFQKGYSVLVQKQPSPQTDSDDEARPLEEVRRQADPLLPVPAKKQPLLSLIHISEPTRPY